MIDFSKIFKQAPSIDLRTGELKEARDDRNDPAYQKFIKDNELNTYLTKPTPAQFDSLQKMQESKQRIDPIVSLVKQGELEKAYEAFEQLPFGDQTKIAISPGVGDALAAYEVPLFEKRAIEDLRTGNITSAKLNHFMASLSAASLIPAADAITQPIKATIRGVQKLGRNVQAKVPMDNTGGGSSGGPQKKLNKPKYTIDDYGFYSEAQNIAFQLPKNATARQLVDGLKARVGPNKPVQKAELDFLNLEEEFVKLYDEDRVISRDELVSFIEVRKPSLLVNVRGGEVSDEVPTINIARANTPEKINVDEKFIREILNSQEFKADRDAKEKVGEYVERFRSSRTTEERNQAYAEMKKAQDEYSENEFIMFKDFIADKVDELTDGKLKMNYPHRLIDEVVDEVDERVSYLEIPEAYPSGFEYNINLPLKIHRRDADITYVDGQGFQTEGYILDRGSRGFLSFVDDRNNLGDVRTYARGRANNLEEADVQLSIALRQRFTETTDAEDRTTLYGPSDFKAFTSPGSENYRESIIEITNKGVKDANIQNMFTKYHPSEKGHFPEPYQVAHKRTTDRVDIDGNLNNHLEEVQSDPTKAKRSYGAITDAFTLEDYVNLPLKNLEKVDMLEGRTELVDVMRDYSDKKIKDFNKVYEDILEQTYGREPLEAYKRVNQRYAEKNKIGKLSFQTMAKYVNADWKEHRELFQVANQDDLEIIRDAYQAPEAMFQDSYISEIDMVGEIFEEFISPILDSNEMTPMLQRKFGGNKQKIEEEQIGDIFKRLKLENKVELPSNMLDLLRSYESNYGGGMGDGRVLKAAPDFPFLDDRQWTRLVLRQHILESIKEGHDGITMPTGYFQNIRNLKVPHVEIKKGTPKEVSIAFGDEQINSKRNTYKVELPQGFIDEIDYYDDVFGNDFNDPYNFNDRIDHFHSLNSQMGEDENIKNIVSFISLRLGPDKMRSPKQMEKLQKQIENHNFDKDPVMIVPLHVVYKSIYDQLLIKEAERLARLTGAKLDETMIYVDPRIKNAEARGLTVKEIEDKNFTKYNKQPVVRLKFNDKLIETITDQGIQYFSKGGLVTGPDVVPFTKEDPAERINPITGEPYMDRFQLNLGELDNEI